MRGLYSAVYKDSLVVLSENARHKRFKGLKLIRK